MILVIEATKNISDRGRHLGKAKKKTPVSHRCAHRPKGAAWSFFSAESDSTLSPENFLF